jgi:hypothetical protein
MNRERLKLIVHNLELLVRSLKDELNEDEKISLKYEEIAPFISSFDEDDDIEYYDEDGEDV